MNWFSGTIPAAIQQSKTNQTVFVVYITGADVLSKEMDNVWDTDNVTDAAKTTGIVAIKVDAQSDTCAQFSAIYPVVTVPCTYFIGNDGKPIEVVAGSKTAEELAEIVTKVTRTNSEKSSGGVSSISEPSTSSTVESQPSSVDQTSSSSTERSVEEKARIARELLDKKRIEKAVKEQEEAKLKEKERRELGKNLGKLQEWKEEKQMQEVKEELKKDKEEARKAKERVKEQIARDREERHRKYQKEKDEREQAKEEARQAKLKEEQAAKDREAAQKSSVARIQFRMTDGSFVTEQFPSTETLETARQFIAQNTNRAPSSFRLCMSYPRREFTQNDMNQSLADLGLAPSAALMVLPPARGRGTGTVSTASNQGVFYMLLAPLIALWNFLYSLIFGRPASSSSQPTSGGTASPSSAHAQSSSYTSLRPGQSSEPRKRPAVSRRDGNVHRLNRDDDDDEMNTWNGNSTQQM